MEAAPLYEPVERCIYCGTERYWIDRKQLGDEHIVPLCLNGRHVLPRASCRRCEGLTGGLEQQLFGQHGTFRAARAHARARSRRGSPEQVYRTLSLFVDEQGRTVRLDVPATFAPHFVYEIKMPPPGLLDGRGSEFPEGRVSLTAHQLNPAARFPIGQRVFAPWISITNALRLPAKIAHGYAVAELGFDKFKPYLLDFILTKDPPNAPWLYIGGSDPVETDQDYDLNIFEAKLGSVSLVVVDIQLLAALKMPRWRIIAGEMK